MSTDTTWGTNGNVNRDPKGPQETSFEAAERMGATIIGHAALIDDDHLNAVHRCINEVIRRQAVEPWRKRREAASAGRKFFDFQQPTPAHEGKGYPPAIHE